MGGYGSGRYGGRPTAEGTASFVLDIARLRQAGLKLGTAGEISMTFESSWDGKLSVELGIDARQLDAPRIKIRHATRDSEGQEIAYSVSLMTTRPHFGGLRWWFICPARGQLCAKLFLPNGGRRFLSREAYRLGYGCQRETRADRLERRARKLKRALGSDGEYGSPIPPKPNGMHWRTYEQKAAQLAAYESAADEAWLLGMPARLLRAIGDGLIEP